ncbi:hypothetical protein I4U23_011681 [Adineta vaga]|nr:hypothetical protein I4U23_011681 [Adineta vaga]
MNQTHHQHEESTTISTRWNKELTTGIAGTNEESITTSTRMHKETTRTDGIGEIIARRTKTTETRTRNEPIKRLSTAISNSILSEKKLIETKSMTSTIAHKDVSIDNVQTITSTHITPKSRRKREKKIEKRLLTLTATNLNSLTENISTTRLTTRKITTVSNITRHEKLKIPSTKSTMSESTIIKNEDISETSSDINELPFDLCFTIENKCKTPSCTTTDESHFYNTRKTEKSSSVTRESITSPRVTLTEKTTATTTTKMEKPITSALLRKVAGIRDETELTTIGEETNTTAESSTRNKSISTTSSPNDKRKTNISIEKTIGLKAEERRTTYD